jgi:gliding motility-associated-like protein
LQTYLNCDGSCINDSDNDGVCNENEIPGCTDELACNYNASATDDDASCTYPLQTYLNCDGSCINDTDNDGVCNENEVLGCTNALACDFNPLATDSGVCSLNAAELLIGQIQNASCSAGLGTVQILNFDQFNSYYFVNEDQEIAAVASVSGLSDGEYMIIGKLTDACVSDTVTFVMGYNNDCSPLAVNDSLFINEDAGTMQLNLVANDTDADNNLDIASVDIDPSTAGIQTTSSGPEGNWSVDANGVLSFTPALNYFGTTTRLYVVSDSAGLLSNTALINIEVAPVNDAPVISPESLNVTVDLNSTTTICLDASDVDGDNVAVSSWLLMEGLGTIDDNIVDDYCFDFTALGWQIPTNIMVIMCDNGTPSLCDTVWVTINVNAPSPIAVDDYITSNDGLVNIDVVLNDTLYGDNNFTVTIIDSTDFGRVDLDTSLISYQPDWSYCGLDSMTYSVCNSFGMCDTATVYFEVTPVDSDLDGIPDYIETTTSDIDGDGIFNHLDEDSDGDGLTDAEESGMSDLCSPTLSDCNKNGIPDYIDFNNCIPDLEIPEGFSPNGDGVNDSWVIPGIENYPNNTVVIFNRWGNQVYSAEPYDNSWSGECTESATIGGSTLPEGTYFFVFKSERNATAKQGYIYIKR